jgi:hypothetical protein
VSLLLVIHSVTFIPSCLVIEDHWIAKFRQELHRQEVIVREGGPAMTHDDRRSLRYFGIVVNPRYYSQSSDHKSAALAGNM